MVFDSLVDSQGIEQSVEPISRIPLQFWDDVRVRVHREGDGGVPKQLHDHSWMGTLRQQQRCCGVAQRVERHCRQSRVTEDGLQSPPYRGRV